VSGVCGKWPFSPVHITNDARKYPDRPDIALLTGQGILPNEHLQGLETGICARVRNATTMIEFSPEGVPVRTDSIIPGHRFVEACRLFREYTSEEPCRRSDNDHACLFYGIPQAETYEEFGRAIRDRIRAKVHRSASPDEARYDIDFDDHQGFLWYDCPILGYRELIFPVFCEGTVVAVLFVGQIVPQERLSEIAALQERNLLNEGQWPLGLDDRADADRRLEVLQSNLDMIERGTLPDGSPAVTTPDGYKDIIRSSLDEVRKLEDTLKKQVSIDREHHARKCVSAAIDKLHKALPREFKATDKPIEGLWTTVSNRLDELVTEFALEYALLFGAKEENRFSADDLPVAAHGGQVPFDMDGVGVRFSTASDHETAVENVPTGLYGVPADLIPQGRSIFVRHQLPFRGSGSLAFLFVFPESMSHGSREFTEAIRTFGEAVVSVVSSTLAVMAEHRTRTSLTMLGHETGTLTAGIDQLLETYLSDPHDQQNLDEKKLADVYYDLRSFFELHDHLFTKAKKFAEFGWRDPRPVRRHFYVVSKLLHKWKDLHRISIRDRGLQWHVPPARREDHRRPPMFADQDLIEQLLYNLTSNAIKYCHPGTKVSMDYYSVTENGRRLQFLTVTDYGVKVSEDNDPDFDPFALFSRGSSEKGSGEGVGLFLAKRIAQAHGGDISHNEDPISRFNVPLLAAYVEDALNEPVPLNEAKEALDKLRNERILNSIVALQGKGRQMYPPSGEARRLAITHILEPTYEVTFTAMIPDQEEKR